MNGRGVYTTPSSDARPSHLGGRTVEAMRCVLLCITNTALHVNVAGLAKARAYDTIDSLPVLQITKPNTTSPFDFTTTPFQLSLHLHNQ